MGGRASQVGRGARAPVVCLVLIAGLPTHTCRICLVSFTVSIDRSSLITFTILVTACPESSSFRAV